MIGILLIAPFGSDGGQTYLPARKVPRAMEIAWNLTLHERHAQEECHPHAVVSLHLAKKIFKRVA